MQSTACGFIGLRSREAMRREKLSVLQSYGNIHDVVVWKLANEQIVNKVEFYFVDDFNDARKVSYIHI